jgi:hypothetical protein
MISKRNKLFLALVLTALVAIVVVFVPYKTQGLFFVGECLFYGWVVVLTVMIFKFIGEEK